MKFTVRVPIVGYAELTLDTEDFEGYDDTTTAEQVLDDILSNEVDMDINMDDIVQWNTISDLADHLRSPSQFEHMMDQPVALEVE